MGDSWIEGLQKKVWYWMDHAADTREMTPAEQREYQEQHKFENTYHSANVVAGVCSSPTVSQVRDLLKHAAEQTRKARQILKITKNFGGISGAFADAAAAIDRGAKYSGNTNAACEISEAIAVLNQWEVSPQSVSPLDAAKAFDKLLGGAAEFMKGLPPPANGFAQIFEEIRKDNFFSNMVRQTDPENPNTPAGQTLRSLN